MLSTWNHGETVDLHQHITRLMLEIISRVLFSVDISGPGAEIVAKMRTMQEATRIRASRIIPIPDFAPTPANIRMRSCARTIEKIVYRLIAQRRSDPNPPADLLSSLLNARDLDGVAMSDRQLRDEIMTLLLAGHETTATTLEWSLLLLAQHPEKERKLQQELDTVLGNRLPTADDLSHLMRTDWVINEAMRLFPPLWTIGREAIKPCTIAGFPIPVGTNVFVSNWVMHRDPRYFPDPDTFHPERWGDHTTSSLPPFVYTPYGAGPRVCVAARLAQIELVLLLATIARRFVVRLTDQTTIRPRALVTLRPDGPIMVRIVERNRIDEQSHA
jgi:cytochrome P450